jgi:hypothetical protein
MQTQKPKLQHLDPKTLEIPAVRIDSAFEDDILAMFADDVKKTGIEDPLKIARCDGHLWVVDGRHRLEQALLNGFPTVPCIVREMDLKTIQMRNLVTNRLRGKTKTSEEIRVIGDLYTTHGVSIDEIVSKTGMRRERLETMILIAQAHPDILRELDKDTISVCHATQLIRLPEKDQQSKMLMLALQYHPKCDDLRGWVDSALETLREQAAAKASPAAAPVPPVPAAPCACCRNEFAIRDLAAPFLCRGCYATLISAHQELQKLEAADAARRSAAAATEPGKSESVVNPI